MFIENEIMIKENKMKPYFKDEGFELYLDDCRDFLNNLPKECVHMIFADPP